MAIDNLDATSVNIFLCCWTRVDMMFKVATKGTFLSLCTVLVIEEVRFWVRGCKGWSGDRGGNRWGNNGCGC